MVGVLLVEDDTATADLYALKLRLDGFAVSVACDSSTAVRTFLRERPAVVCLDQRLPDAPGAALAETFAAAGARIVLFTNDQSIYERPPACVARSVLKARTKPGQLSAMITELIESTPATV